MHLGYDRCRVYLQKAPERWHANRARSMPNECNITTEAFQTIFRMNANTATETVPNEIPNRATERGRIWPPSVPNSLPNGTMRESRDNYQEMITEISQRRISLPRTSHGDRMRELPGAIPYQATDRDVYRMAYRRIKQLSPNSIPNWMPNDHTQGLPNDYR